MGGTCVLEQTFAEWFRAAVQELVEHREAGYFPSPSKCWPAELSEKFLFWCKPVSLEKTTRNTVTGLYPFQ